MVRLLCTRSREDGVRRIGAAEGILMMLERRERREKREERGERRERALFSVSLTISTRSKLCSSTGIVAGTELKSHAALKTLETTSLC